jgi:hypothetical protein
MAIGRFEYPIEPMPLDNMRTDGVAVPTFGACMVCTQFGGVGADARSNRKEQRHTGKR